MTDHYRIKHAANGLFYPQYRRSRDLLDIIFFSPKWVFLNENAVVWAATGWLFYEKDPVEMARFSTEEEAEEFIARFDQELKAWKQRQADKYLRTLRGVK